MKLTLRSLDDSAALGRALAHALAAPGAPRLLLLEGGLGAGKTTLTRFLAEALPGGAAAEVTSPSFTLCNIYPTRPELWHYDLYRLAGGEPPDELLEALDYLYENPEDGAVLIVIEWPERLPAKFLPGSYLHCRLTAEENDRRASFEGHGKSALKTLALLAKINSEKGS